MGLLKVLNQIIDKFSNSIMLILKIFTELGELPILTLHKLAQKREDSSGKYYPEERGLARVCNPIGR